ncbi:hypothetical protein Y032_0012g1684 [Ancylostoma ceylanicum]|uniref:Uncharacterized protein n=1 Tax=Ancylostoma ceylanicum TaxID=53326 RepID=A0A016VCF2_9BILA|nr:hypothetical protein Y032_0012g1684 [Ancylostoma ceylanicum]
MHRYERYALDGQQLRIDGRTRAEPDRQRTRTLARATKNGWAPDGGDGGAATGSVAATVAPPLKMGSPTDPVINCG